MQLIPLEAIPNQEFSIRLNDQRYVITIKEIDSQLMGVSIMRDGVMLVQNVRAIPGRGILRYKYLIADQGEFAFSTMNDEFPHWTKFNVTQQFMFATPEEIAAGEQ